MLSYLTIYRLRYRWHQLGKSFLDASLTTLMPNRATVSNTTFEEDNTALTYSGKWDSNKSPNFSGGGTSFTNQDKAAVSLSFHGL